MYKTFFIITLNVLHTNEIKHMTQKSHYKYLLLRSEVNNEINK